MIVFGICLLIIAAIVPKLAVLWGIGIIVLVVGGDPRRTRLDGTCRRRATPLLLTRSSRSRSRPIRIHRRALTEEI
jgi:hypothetical protein